MKKYWDKLTKKQKNIVYAIILFLMIPGPILCMEIGHWIDAREEAAFREMMSGFSLSAVPAPGADKLAAIEVVEDTALSVSVPRDSHLIYTSRYIPKELLAASQDEVGAILVYRIETVRIANKDRPDAIVAYYDLHTHSFLESGRIQGELWTGRGYSSFSLHDNDVEDWVAEVCSRYN